MTLFDSTNPAIRKAQALVLETLASIPDEYGAAFVVGDYQDELARAVREHTQRLAVRKTAKRLNELQAAAQRRERRAVLGLVELDDWRVA